MQPKPFKLAIEDNKKQLEKIPIHLRPKKEDKPVQERNPAEARAIVAGIRKSIRIAEETGYIVKIKGGYQISWNKK